MLGVMSDIAMDLVSNVGTSLFLSKEAVKFVTEETILGLADTATQQLGLGLILSTLLIVVPPMAGMWFNGVMAGFSAYSVIGNGNRQEVPPHLDGGASQRVNYNIQNRAKDTDNNAKVDTVQQNLWTTGGSRPESTTTDAMKQSGQPR